MSKPISNNPSGLWKVVLLLIIVGAAALMISPVSADTGSLAGPAGSAARLSDASIRVTGFTADPEGNPPAGTPVTVSFVVNFTPTGNVTFPSTDDLMMSTDLENPKWTFILDLDGIANPQDGSTGKTATLTGWRLSFPSSAKESLRVTLRGTAPPGSSSGSLTLASITVIDEQGHAIGSPVIRTSRVSPPAVPDKGVTITRPVQLKYHIWEDTVTFSGTNTGSGITYLFITGPNLKTNGAQIQSIHPFQSPVIDDDASTFQAARVGPDNTWSYTWDTHNVMIDSGTYTLYAASSPRDLAHINSTQFDRISFIMAPPGGMVRPAGSDTSSGDAASAGTGVTIAASGTRSYYQGEKVVLQGMSPDADTVYLFLTGPNLPATGGKLTSPRQAVVSGNPGSFDTVKTKADKSWEYVYYTHNLNVDAGTYTVYAVSQPKAKDQLNGVGSADIGIILKKPFLTGEISPASISKGQPFTVSGTAEGDPESVQIWILGKNYYSRATESVGPDASYTFEVPREVTSHLESGQNFVIVQHSMMNNQFDIDVSGDNVRNLKLNNGTNLFRISGPGSLQGSDAADALVAAFSDPATVDDTYTEIPFQISDAGSSTPQATDAASSPVKQTTQHGLLGAIGEAFRSFLNG
jgi:hypothetical protein